MTKPLLAILLLLPLVAHGEERIGIKNFRLGMPIAEVEDALAIDFYCAPKGMSTFADCIATKKIEGGKNEAYDYRMTIAGQNCELVRLYATNEGESSSDKKMLAIYEAHWFCEKTSDVIKDALRRRYGEPTSEYTSHVPPDESVLIPGMYWEFPTEWELLPRQQSETDAKYGLRTCCPDTLTLDEYESHIHVYVEDRRTRAFVRFLRETNEMRDL